MNTVSLLLAWRYLCGSRNERSISWMVIICFISILIGSCALAVVIAIMNGFEKETCKKLQGIHASISIDAQGESLDWPAIKKILDDEFPQISASTPTTGKQVIIQLPRSDDISNVVLLRAIEPSSQAQVTTIEQTIEQKKNNALSTKISTSKKFTKTVRGEPVELYEHKFCRSNPSTSPSRILRRASGRTECKTSFEELNSQRLSNAVNNNTLLIGSSLATLLETKKGDILTILFIPEDEIQSQRISFEQKDVIIGGTFKTGIEEFDNHVVYCSFDLLEKLFPDSGVTQIDVRLYENTDEETVVKQLKKRLMLNVYSWKQLYPALVSALKLEKYAMFLILSLIILVASMNIMSLLFMQIVQKCGDIAILKALGMAHSAIRSIFFIMGMIIAFVASIIGLLIAFLICLFLKQYPFIQLPDAYYVTHLPVSIEWDSFVLIFLSIILISSISTCLATYKTTHITIASVLHFKA